MKLNGHNYEEHTLENGLTVHMLRTPHKRINAELQLQHGANHEEEAELGLAHYLEHVVTVGGGETYSPEEVDEIQDGFGDSNAYTEGDKTSYVGTFLTKQLSTFLKTTEDIVFHTPLRQEIIDREREAILREIAMYVGEPSYEDIQEMYRTFYDQECFHRIPLGKENIVENASQEQLAKFLKRGYSPNNAKLLLVGGLPNNTKALVEEIFGALPKGEGEKFIYPTMGPLKETVLLERAAPDLINKENNENSNAELIIFCQAPRQGSDEEIAMNITNKLLGGGRMSVMLRKLRIENGLAYSAGSQYSAYPAGVMYAYSDVLAQEVNTARELIYESFADMKEKAVSPQRLENVRNKIKYRFLRESERPEGCLSGLERFLDYKLTNEEILKRTEAVTQEDIFRVSQKYLPTPDDPHVVLIRNPLL